MHTNTKPIQRISLVAIALSFASTPSLAEEWSEYTNRYDQCHGLPGQYALKSALESAVAAESSGLDFEMWATIVNRDGVVCAVAFSGDDRGAQWPGSRAISAQKANTANAFSLDGLALSTANLFSAAQPGGSLFGLQHSNSVDTDVAYKGPSRAYGQHNDPMVGQKIGWRVRNNLHLDQLAGTVGGVSGDSDRPDNILYDIAANPNGGTGVSAGGFGHPECLNTGDPSMVQQSINDNIYSID